MYSPSAIAADTREMLLFAAGPLDWGDNRKGAIARAARLVGIQYSRAFNIIYGRSKRIEASEYLTIKARVEALRSAQDRNREAIQHVASKMAAVAGAEIAEGFGDAD